MLAADLVARIEERVEALAGRVEGAAELAELIRQNAWPQASPAAFVIPLGLTALSQGDAAAGAFTQAVGEMWGVLLVVRAAGDITGAKAWPKIDELVWQVIAAVCGWAPDDQTGVFRLARGGLVGASAGRVSYQLDFVIEDQVRIIA